MKPITYAKLTAENFKEYSLDSFKRYQEIQHSLRKTNNKYVYVNNTFIEDWDSEKCRQVANDIVKAVENSAIAYGAFCDGVVVGFAYLGSEYFGTEKQHMELKMFHVSNEFRNNGIGKVLFLLICADARKTDAKKLYISAHSVKESQEAYNHCVSI